MRFEPSAVAVEGSSHNRGKILYLSYDGMCDQLGASQVLPYLTGLAQRGHEISLISFEKPERSAAERAAVEEICAGAGISWHPLAYHKRPPVLSSMYDVRQMRRVAQRLHAERAFELVHCRSYLPALVGLKMKRQDRVPFLFDMRGFWADERVEGGIWDLSKPAIRAVYRYFKSMESAFLAEADHIVSLTDEAKAILLARRPHHDAGPPISVIPCCVDFDAFPPVDREARSAARALLGIPDKATVAAYLGSFGSWYMTDEMLDFFRVQLERDSGAMFLIVSREPSAAVEAAAASRGVATERLVIRSAARAEVPKLLAAADYGLFFIMPVFSKKASSPTKMGEFLALELPIVTNGGVGDVSRIMAECGAGVVVDAFDDAAYGKAIDDLRTHAPDMQRWRDSAHRWFDLGNGIDRYDGIYQATIAHAAENQRGS